MKIVKLNKTHNLYYKGYKYALRFPSTWAGMPVYRRMYDRYGRDYTIWNDYRPKRKYPYWIGVKEEQYLTMILLTL